jgi:hypothetical protein
MVGIPRFFRMKLLLLLVLCSALNGTYAQRVLPENLSAKVKVYWDANNKRLHSTGAYYVDEIVHLTTEKHGKWLFYSFDGFLQKPNAWKTDNVFSEQANKNTVFCAIQCARFGI